jgi:phenylpropionate dioxygenase-like ring-hydroxylating dioxygenase large terminal subunit
VSCPSSGAQLDGSFAVSQTCANWACHISRCIENQLDYAHLPFVHRTSIGRGFDVRKKPSFHFDETSIKMVMGNDNLSPFIEFRYPGVWMNHINKNFRVVAVFSPADEHHTEVYLRSYQRFFNVPLVRNVMGIVFNMVNRVVLNQDYAVVMSQRPDSSINISGETLFASDKAIVQFRRWWQGRAASQPPSEPRS